MDEEEQGYKWMMNSKKSSQIPAFGNWEYADDLPITQYFECARQAGLFRFSNSSGECAADLYGYDYVDSRDLYPLNFNKPPVKQKTRGGCDKGCPHVKDQNKNEMKKKKQQAGFLKEPPRKQQQQLPKHSKQTASNNKITRRQQTTTTTTTKARVVRAVDEDLYKISPDLLQSAKRKRRLGFFSRCFVPACIV